MAAAAAMLPDVARAQLVISGNDEKVVLDPSRAALANIAPGKDSVSLIDIANREAPRIVANLPLMNSIFGPPTNLAITPDRRLALVANSMTWQADGAAWKPVPDNKVYVIDLTTNPPAQVATVEVGKQPSGMSINARGDLALVANRADNSISVLAIHGREVKLVDTIAMGDSVAAVAISPDGKRALAVKFPAHKVALLEIDGQKVTYNKVDLPTGLWPYNVDITPNGKLALVADNGAAGAADGNVDTVTVIDLEAAPPRVIDRVVVGDAPEGFAISPRGDLAVAVLIGAPNVPKTNWFYKATGSLAILKIDGKKVTKVQEVPVGGLPEGIAFSPDGGHIYVGNYLDRDLWVLKVDGAKVTDTGKRLQLPGQPASLRGAAYSPSQ